MLSKRTWRARKTGWRRGDRTESTQIHSITAAGSTKSAIRGIGDIRKKTSSTGGANLRKRIVPYHRDILPGGTSITSGINAYCLIFCSRPGSIRTRQTCSILYNTTREIDVLPQGTIVPKGAGVLINGA